MLLNKKTGLEITQESIYSKDENGIIVKNYNCLKFIPWEEIEEVYSKERNEYYSSEAVPQYSTKEHERNFHSSETEPEKFFTQKARYRFGVKGIRFYERKYDADSAICSLPVDVSGADFITISVKEEECYNSAVEFYVLDGAIEQPIMPEGITEIRQEKLFCGLGTRFIADGSTIKLYEDGKLCQKNYLAISYTDFLEHEYTVDYVPLEAVHQYVPENKTIKIKMIIRNYTDTYSPALIAGVTVNKHGGELEWN